MHKVSLRILLIIIFVSVSFFILNTRVMAVVNNSSPTSSSDGLIRPAVITGSSISAFIDSTSQTSSSTSSAYNVGKTIKLTLEKQIQSIFDKSEPVKITINSNIATDRLEISWTFDEKNLKLGQQTTEFKTIKANEPLVLTYDFTPLKESVNTIYVRVQAWQNEANYPEVSSIELTFNKNLEIVPQTEDYKSNLLIFNTFKTIALVAIGIGILAVSFLLLKRFFKWFEKD